MNEELNLLKASRRLEVLLDQSKVAMFSGLACATTAVVIFWNRAEQEILLIWLGFYYLVSLLRFYVTRRHNQRNLTEIKVDRIFQFYSWFTFLGGVLWGAMSIYLIKNEILVYSVTVIVLIEALIASAASSYSISTRIFLSFAYPALLPTAIFLIFQSDDLLSLHGWLAALFLFVNTVTATKFNRHLLTSVDYQFENVRLLGELEQGRKQMSDLNLQLEMDLEQLRETEEQLRSEKNKAEDLANKLFTLSSLDGLTGIANRRHLDEFLAKEWNRAIRQQTEICLMLCDLDYFKAYNDHFGHQKGDKCLQLVAGILEEHARRGGDLAARYGGEEFALILPETSLDNATKIAEQIRLAIEELAVLHPESAIHNVITISIGVASIVPVQHMSSSVLISQADRKLYEAKSEGRNRVIS